MKNKTIIVFLIFILISCKTRTNFDLIKEYFIHNQNTLSVFSRKCEWESNFDSVIVNESISIHNDGFVYSVQLMGNKLEIIFTPNSIIATKDSSSSFSILEKSNYERKMNDIFIEPSYKNIRGKYSDYNNKDINDKDSNSLEIRIDYAYKIYFTIDKQDLILHKDYSFKTERKWSYYFSKEKGLYKIIFLEYNKCTLLKN